MEAEGTQEPSPSQVPTQLCEAQSGQQTAIVPDPFIQQREPEGQPAVVPGVSVQSPEARAMQTPPTQIAGLAAVPPVQFESQLQAEPAAPPPPPPDRRVTT